MDNPLGRFLNAVAMASFVVVIVVAFLAPRSVWEQWAIWFFFGMVGLVIVYHTIRFFFDPRY